MGYLASKADVDALTLVVGLKANQTAMTAVQNALPDLASAASVTALNLN